MSYTQQYQDIGGNPYQNSGAAEAGYGGVSKIHFQTRSLFIITYMRKINIEMLTSR